MKLALFAFILMALPAFAVAEQPDPNPGAGPPDGISQLCDTEIQEAGLELSTIEVADLMELEGFPEEAPSAPFGAAVHREAFGLPPLSLDLDPPGLKGEPAEPERRPLAFGHQRTMLRPPGTELSHARTSCKDRRIGV